MFRLNDGHFVREFRTLLFHHIIFLPLIQSSIGEVQIIGSSQPILATVGDDIILPCHLKPAVDASNMPVAWLRPDLNPTVVHLWKEGAELVFTKHIDYDARTSLSLRKMKQGDISLTLHKVVLTDNGTYKCYLQVLNISSSVELVVGAVSSPVATIAQMIKKSSSKVILQCESKGWYPQPEVFWLDDEGNLLSAEPTETVRGPDGLYTVSSRVTVEKSHSNNFTCRVKTNKHTRETHIIVPDILSVSDQPNSSSSVPTIIGVIVGIIFIIIAVLAVWKWRQNKCKAANRVRENNHSTSNNPSVQYHAVAQGPQTEKENVRCRIHLPTQEGNWNNETEVDGQHEHIPLSRQNVNGDIQQLILEEEQDIRNNEMRNVLAETLRKLEEEKNKSKAFEDENKMLKENLENVQLQLEDEKERSDQLEKNLKNVTLQLVERDNKHKDSELEVEEQDTSEESDAEHKESEHEDSKHEDSDMDSATECSDFDNSRL
ncbi:butyrophilin subfamily 3 member A2-like [Scomber scombrus]|uniref:butyrophilin subfamily 3 member A2-like n=1 Tax=Scomber scombrus TaxID=13677 RepID=UPI002DDA68F3|nr:butyrophilin subfamily 3 member A2-like [Scomber scombrus]